MAGATGGCACGRVRYQATGDLRSVANCHCEPCRRITGHFMAATATASDQLAFESDTTLMWYDSTPTVQYGFCSACGSTLFWRASDKPGHVSITAGTLDTPTGLKTTLALFGDEASDYHDLDRSIETVARDRALGGPVDRQQSQDGPLGFSGFQSFAFDQSAEAPGTGTAEGAGDG